MQSIRCSLLSAVVGWSAYFLHFCKFTITADCLWRSRKMGFRVVGWQLLLANDAENIHSKPAFVVTIILFLISTSVLHSCQVWQCFLQPRSKFLMIEKVMVAHTRLPSVGFRSWSRFLAVSLQVTCVINPAVGCHYFSPGLQLPCSMLITRLPSHPFR